MEAERERKRSKGEVVAMFGGRKGEKEEERKTWTKSLFYFLPGWKALNLKKIVIFFIFVLFNIKPDLLYWFVC